MFRQRYRRLCLKLLLALCSCCATSDVAGQSDSEITEFAQGLRARRLYDLAEAYCREGLTNQELDATTATSLTLELIRTQAARAANSSGSKREQSWADAKQTAQDFLASHGAHPRKLLVQVQLALTHLTHGRLLRQEIDAHIALENAREEALSELRTATSLLEDVQRSIRKIIPEQRGRTLGEHELSVDQLTMLNNNVRLQAAICGINRARLYPNDDQLNRIDALNMGLEKLNAVRRETNSEQPLWWDTELQRAICQRLLGKLSEAQKILADLPLQEANLATKQAVIEQQIKLLIASGNLRNGAQILAQVEQIKNHSPELDLAVVELMMRLADTVDKSWRNKASEQLSRIESEHGAYWGRRAELLVIGTAGKVTNSNSSATNDPGSPDLLIRIGDQAVRQNRLDDALKAFTQAIKTATDQKNWQLVFATTVKNAQVLEKQKNHAAASQQLIELATQFADSEYAAAAHLRGCWNFSRTGNASPDLVSERTQEFARLLDQHLTTWPDAESANQARVWLAGQLHSEHKWQLAIEQYLAVRVDHQLFPAAVNQSVACMIQWMGESESDASSFAQEYTNRLIGILNAADLTQAGRAQALLALSRVGLTQSTIKSADLAIQLQNAIPAAAPENKLPLLAWLLVAEADSEDSSDVIEQTFSQITDDESALFESLTGINAILSRKSESAATTLINSKLMLAKRALELNLNESKRTQWMGEWAHALQRLGRDEEAVAALEELAKRQPKSALAQMQLARGLSKINGEDEQRRALTQWRRVATQLKPQTENWYEAKFNVALSLQQLGDQSQALKLLEYLKAIPPGWSNSKWKDDFERLLIKCQNE